MLGGFEEKGSFSPLSGAREWGTRIMRHGGDLRFQLVVTELLLPALAATSPWCVTLWELEATQD